MGISTTKDLAKFREACRAYYAPNPRNQARTKPNPELFREPVVRGYAKDIMDEEEKKAQKP